MTKTLRRLQRRGGDKSNPTTQAAKEKAAVIRKQFEEMGREAQKDSQQAAPGWLRTLVK